MRSRKIEMEYALQAAAVAAALIMMLGTLNLGLTALVERAEASMQDPPAADLVVVCPSICLE